MKISDNLTGPLAIAQKEIRKICKDHGLDFFEVIYKVCDVDTINLLAARTGFPNRYPHWKFGQEYDHMRKQHKHNLGKIYELVINSDPCYAYLLDSNDDTIQKLVMAHVYAHSDFFKNNKWFSNTNRDMMETTSTHAYKIKGYIEKYGVDVVESFLDKVMSIQDLISVRDMFDTSESEILREERENELKEELKIESQELEDSVHPSVRKYLRQKEAVREEEKVDHLNHIKEPERDIMKFLAKHAPVEDWQADIIGILREEAYYFLPQRMTKIMNEGWATYWHTELMSNHIINPSEVIDFGDLNSGVLAMGQQLNPYKLGYELFKSIKHRWDTGQHGKKFLECDSLAELENWDDGSMKGLDQMFFTRSIDNDITFIEKYLTEEFCIDHKLFVYKTDEQTGKQYVDTTDFASIKETLLQQLSNFGTPVIDAVHPNGNNAGELCLVHRHNGVDLDQSYAESTMKNIYEIWKRPVTLETINEDKAVRLRYDGKFSTTGI